MAETLRIRIPFMLLLVISFLLTGMVRADEVDVDDGVKKVEDADSGVLREMEQLRFKISSLDAIIAEKNREIERKEGALAEIDKSLKEKSHTIATLQREIELIQNKEAVDSAELLEKSHSRSASLEKQVENLKSELQLQNKNKEVLLARATEFENRVEVQTSKLKNLEKINAEQQRRIKKTERLLKVAEEELVKEIEKAASKIRELTEIHGAWLPTWLAVHLDHCLEYTITEWNHHGKPALESFLQKASEISAQAQKHAEPHLDIIKEKWVPTLKDQYATFSTFISPHVKKASTKTIEFYEVTLVTIKPHVLKMQEVAKPYYQDVKKLSKPYIEQVASVAKPHVEKVRITLKPYTKKAVRVYGKFLKTSTVYHHQVQALALENLQKYELTKALATKELVWFLASAILALPIYLLYNIILSIFCTKPRKPSQNSQDDHPHRRHKRRHVDK
ncbi:Myosin heavy chain-related protein [Zostera marina]|uniref:Myosin heavy chain-related protein n=1 Tax=Zostera marina TaxID=29655 RepID=A0A0K9P0C9_ZOSMR|nr:Myosin heavy chain-related protein [Zostera marina]